MYLSFDFCLSSPVTMSAMKAELVFVSFTVYPLYLEERINPYVDHLRNYPL